LHSCDDLEKRWKKRQELPGLLMQSEENEKAQKERDLAAEYRKKIEVLEQIISNQSKEDAKRWLKLGNVLRKEHFAMILALKAPVTGSFTEKN